MLDGLANLEAAGCSGLNGVELHGLTLIHDPLSEEGKLLPGELSFFCNVKPDLWLGIMSQNISK